MNPQGLAAKVDRAVSRVEASARAQVRRVATDIQVATLAAFDADRDPIAAAGAAIFAAVGPIAMATMVAVLGGRWLVRQMAPKANRRAVRAESFLERAARTLTARLGVDAISYQAAERVIRPAIVRIIEGASAQLEAALSKRIGEMVSAGFTVREARDGLAQALKSFGVSPLAPYRLEEIVRRQSNLATTAGIMLEVQSPDLAEDHWGWTYVTAGDDRVRPSHAALDGTTLPKSDPEWLTIAPPNGYNCRCRIIPLFDPERERRPSIYRDDKGLDQYPEPDEGFRISPLAALNLA